MKVLYSKFVEAGYRVSIDSRSVAPGDMFVALKGDKFDGNLYALKALEMGASCAVVSDLSLVGRDSRLVWVEDTLHTLQQLARWHRRELSLPIVALSGTNGKTTTKELLRVALQQKFSSVGCTQGNLNNHIGVPLTLLSLTKEHQIGIVEMGANHPGEIAQLCEIAEPNYGLLTNVGRAHLEGFGSYDGVKKTKGELYDWLKSHQGLAFYNSKDTVLREMIEQRGVELQSVAYDGSVGIGRELKLFGAYNQYNAAAALAVASYFGADKDKVVAALSEYESTNNRSEIIEKSPMGNRLVVDCYNANPSSMEAAVTEFLAQDADKPLVLILGSMRELGEYSSEEHSKLVEMTAGVQRILYVGEEFERVAPSEKYYVNAEAVIAEIAKNKIVNSCILVKGSRGNALEQLLPYL